MKPEDKLQLYIDTALNAEDMSPYRHLQFRETKFGLDLRSDSKSNLLEFLQLDGIFHFRDYYYNELTNSFCVKDGQKYSRVDDTGIGMLALEFNRVISAGWPTNTLKIEAIEDAIMRHLKMFRRINPIAEYLNGLTWDGVSRIDGLVKVLNTENPELTKIVMELMLRASVARVYEPGCKFDFMPILHGHQGIAKGLFLSSLYGEDYISEEPIKDFSASEATEKILGKWAWECSELESFRPSKVDELKAFVTKRSSYYRFPYERTPRDQPRLSILWGSTNKSTFLHDSTGNRRMIVIRNLNEQWEPMEADWIADNRDQIWAEAVVQYHNHGGKGQRLDLDNSTKDILSKINELYTHISELEELMVDDLQDPSSKLNHMIKNRFGLRINDVRRLYYDRDCDLEKHKWNRFEVENVLQKLEFERVMKKSGQRQQPYYVYRGDDLAVDDFIEDAPQPKEGLFGINK